MPIADMRHGPAIADMDLQPVAVMLQLVHPARPGAWLLGDDWPARMNEGAGALTGLPRELRKCHNIRSNYRASILRGIPLWLVRLLSGSVLGLGNDDYQGVYEMLCATYCDCKRL